MAYTTEAKVRAASGFSDTDDMTSATITDTIAAADGIIDGKIRDVYALPLSETPDIIAKISLEITLALLYTDEYGENAQNTNKDYAARLEVYMGILDQIQNKEIKLFDSSNNELATSSLKSPAFKPDNESSAVGERDEPRVTMTTKF